MKFCTDIRAPHRTSPAVNRAHFSSSATSFCLSDLTIHLCNVDTLSFHLIIGPPSPLYSCLSRVTHLHFSFACARVQEQRFQMISIK